MPQAQLRLDELLQAAPDSPVDAPYTNVLALAGTTDNSVAQSVAQDAHNAIIEACNLGHFGSLAVILLGVSPGTLPWENATNDVGSMYHDDTSFREKSDYYFPNEGWGAINPPAGTDARAYLTHLFEPQLTTCLNDQQWPFGYSEVLWNLGAPAHVGNPPAPHSFTGRILPRQSVTLNDQSSALLTISGVSETPALALQGDLEISLSACSADGVDCTATLSSLTLTTAPFSIAGYDIALARVTTTASPVGTLHGDTLAFPSFAGSLEARLTDGRFDNIAITTGVLLGRWDPNNDQFVAAFSIESSEAGADVTLNGTALGAFDNTSPIAVATISSPSSSSSRVECDGPAGTTVVLDSGGSTDREDGTPSISWYDDGRQLLGTDRALTLSSLPVGTTRNVQLMAYDTRGWASNDPIEVRVVDTLPPQITGADLCVFPPNHRNVQLRLGTEIVAAASDRCYGAEPPTIIDVTSSSGDGVVSWSDSTICVSAERDGNNSSGRVYDVTLRAVDGAGNASDFVVHVTVPHDSGGHGACLATNSLERCE